MKAIILKNEDFEYHYCIGVLKEVERLIDGLIFGAIMDGTITGYSISEKREELKKIDWKRVGVEPYIEDVLCYQDFVMIHDMIHNTINREIVIDCV
jgi:hypothetical protein